MFPLWQEGSLEEGMTHLLEEKGMYDSFTFS